MAGKGYKCFHCGNHTMRKHRGVWRCDSCNSIEWSAFERPIAGKPRKGFRCINCRGQTVHPIGRVASAYVSRCSVCGYTYVEPINPA